MIDPFANESESVQIGEMTIENRTDKVEIYGSLDITRSKTGLKEAAQLREILTAIINKLYLEDL